MNNIGKPYLHDAILDAVRKLEGIRRKGSGLPDVVHPIEVMKLLWTI